MVSLSVAVRPATRRGPRGARRLGGAALIAALVGAGVGLWAGAASAELKLCNRTSARVGVALGVEASGVTSTSGWFNVDAGDCTVLLPDALGQGPYFVHAIDYDRGGKWGGGVLLCVADEAFSIAGHADCYARGYMRAGFRRIVTNGQRRWTIDLTDAARQTAGGG